MLPGLVSSDSDLVAELLGQAFPPEQPGRTPAETGDDLEQALLKVLPQVEGAFSFVLLDADRLIGVRDPNGFRPLCLGRLEATEEFEQGWVLASESPALDVIGATSSASSSPARWSSSTARRCVRSVPSRPNASTPSSASSSSSTSPGPTPGCTATRCTAPAAGWASCWPPRPRSRPTWSWACPTRASPPPRATRVAVGIPYGQGLVKNRYIGRTFIAPTQAERANGVRRKLNPLRENITGKRVVVVDDSIVRGTTTRAMVTMLRESGAAEVHLRDLLTAVPVAVLLRDRHPGPHRAAGRHQDPRRDRRVPRRRLARVPDPRPSGRGHRRARRRVLRRLPDRRLPGAGAGPVRRASLPSPASPTPRSPAWPAPRRDRVRPGPHPGTRLTRPAAMPPVRCRRDLRGGRGRTSPPASRRSS